jgi:hypothetical protein
MLLGIMSVVGAAGTRGPAAAAPDDLGLAAGHDLLEQIDDDAGPIPDDHPRWEAGFGPEVGVSRVGGQLARSGGLRVDAGLRLDPWTFYATYELVGVAASSCRLTSTCSGFEAPADAYVLEHRLGIEARLDLDREKIVTSRRRRTTPHLIRTDVWIEGGVGRERLGRNAVQSWRNDLEFGVGRAWSERDGSRHGTLELGIRITLAHAPRSEMATLDGSVMIGVGGLFGS